MNNRYKYSSHYLPFAPTNGEFKRTHSSTFNLKQYFRNLFLKARTSVRADSLVNAK
ncbi:MAG: hypothetical protein JJ966_03065 [Balneolaceae bacterium]|nr:hypothetical protein [Balneolaceae bacterium]